MALLKIDLEQLNNLVDGQAVKYSHAHQVTVDLRGLGAALTLTVADDGIGFDVLTTWPDAAPAA